MSNNLDRLRLVIIAAAALGSSSAIMSGTVLAFAGASYPAFELHAA